MAPRRVIVVAAAAFAAAVVALGAVAAQEVPKARPEPKVEAKDQKPVQNLDEMFRRKALLGAATWPWRDLTKAYDRLDWQTETLCFTDTKTGREVWRMTATPNIRNYYHNDIAMSPWSANGKRLGLQSWRAERGRELRNMWMVVDADGSKLRPTVNMDAYCHWSPLLPDVYYTFGGTPIKGVTSDSKVLYKVTVGDDGPATAMQPLLTYPAPGFIGKLISADGKMILAGSADHKQNPYQVTYTPSIIYPDDKAKRLLQAGWSVNLDFGDYAPPFKSGHYHDKYLLGDGTWLYIIDRSFGYWRIRTLGSAADGGPKFTGDDGKGNFGEMIPEYVRKLGKLNDPWKENQYPGHPGFDRWGELVCIANYDTVDEQGKFKIGTSVYDFIHHRPVTGKWIPQSDGAVHCDWEAFADWCVVSVEKSEYSYGDARIECHPYDQVGKNFVVCYTNNFSNGFKGVGASYYGYIRPAQSPDGTKVAFHSDMLNTTDAPDCYWAVCYYPLPPTDIKAETAAGGIKLTWKSPSYTKRGWPKATDPPPPAREIKTFHVWRAKAATGPWEEAGAAPVSYEHDAARAVRVPKGLEFVDHPGDGAWCYALTSEEYSGLESRELSEVLKVDVAGGKLATSAVAAKEGQTGFWKTAPTAPGKFKVEKAETPGQYLLTWEEPKDAHVRYYNIYHSPGQAVAATQQNRIASVVVGTNKFVDWLGDPEGPGAYVITAVDRQGNESKAVAP
jgi:hypothetical protein